MTFSLGTLTTFSFGTLTGLVALANSGFESICTGTSLIAFYLVLVAIFPALFKVYACDSFPLALV